MSNSRLIIKNTTFLYFRMLLTLVVTLFTSRLVLSALGIEEFGIYTLVGGIVLFFSFLNNAMTSATQRFLSFDIGINNVEQLKKTFNASLNIHILIAIIFLLLSETIGLWFLNNKLNIAITKMEAVNWVYQFSVATFLVGIIQVPYDALIISKEKMNVYAYVGIFEVLMKSLIVYLLFFVKGNKLILYAFMLFLISFLSNIIRKIYCKVFFKETKYEYYYNKELYKKLISFSGWSLLGNIAGVSREQGLNVLLNIFFGTILNAAYGITMQVQSAVQIFVYNFQLAINPQILKQYATGEIENSKLLILQSSKFSYFLMLMITCPIIYNIDFILKLWLNNPPVYTSTFIVLSLLNALIDSISGSLVTGAQASGNIKWYQITVGSLVFLSLPISYFFLKLNNEPANIFYIIIVINLIALVSRLVFLKFLIDLDITVFFFKVLVKIFIVTIISIISNHFIVILLENQLYTFLLKSIFITIINLISIYFFGLSESERNFIKLRLSKIKM